MDAMRSCECVSAAKNENVNKKKAKMWMLMAMWMWVIKGKSRKMGYPARAFGRCLIKTLVRNAGPSCWKINQIMTCLPLVLQHLKLH